MDCKKKIHSTDNLMYTYNTAIRKVIEYNWKNKGLTMHSSEILHRPRGIILNESTKITVSAKSIGADSRK
jgi:hypothetical protein